MKKVIGVIGGSALEDANIFPDPSPTNVKTPFGEPSSPILESTVRGVELYFIVRHGKGHTIPPHRVNHKANIWALKSLGVEGIIGTTSSGSLKPEIEPGTVMIPSDYVSLWNIPTFYDDEVVHVTPLLDEDIRKCLMSAAERAGIEVIRSGIYVQTQGPRLETRAEINILKGYGDVVGMTMASEATLAAEVEIPYASICSVDNYCHGIVEEPLTYEDIVQSQEKNAEKVKSIVSKLPEVLS